MILYTFQEADLFFLYFKDELERFPLAQVHEPTAVLKNDRRETYNNLILFTVIDDPRRKNSPSDMHIFQSVNAPVSRNTKINFAYWVICKAFVRVPTSSGNHGKPGKSQKKVPCMENHGI